jgi:alpha-amylase/alpha-mannosidase (GH57 family)
MSDKLKFYSYIEWETIFKDEGWKVGDKKTLPHLFGYATCTLVERTDEHLTWQSGRSQTQFSRSPEGWRWPHCWLDMDAVCKVQVV